MNVLKKLPQACWYFTKLFYYVVTRELNDNEEEHLEFLGIEELKEKPNRFNPFR